MCEAPGSDTQRRAYNMLRLHVLLALTSLFCVGCGAGQPPLKALDLSRPAVSFRWAEAFDSPGHIEATVAGTNERVYVHPSTILSGEDIASAIATLSDDGQASLSMTFNPSGQEKMARASAASSGRRMALVVDGTVVCAVRVLGPMSEHAIIPDAFSSEEARKLAKRINDLRSTK